MPVFRSGSVVPFGKASQRKSEILPDGTLEGQVLSLSKRVMPDMFSAVTILFIWMCARVSCVYARIFVYPTCCWRYTSACVSCVYACKLLAPLAVSAQTVRRLCTFLRTRFFVLPYSISSKFTRRSRKPYVVFAFSYMCRVDVGGAIFLHLLDSVRKITSRDRMFYGVKRSICPFLPHPPP